MYTPGHTDDSYSFLMADRVFTGDTLLIRGTGRTDFQNGDPRAQYDSIFNKLMKLPDETLVYPAHDYKGETVSTIGEEKCFNPRLKVQIGRRIRRSDEQSETAESEDDGCGGAGQHACRPAPAGHRAPGLGAIGGRRDRVAAAAPTWRWSICARKASATSRASFPARCMRPMRTCRQPSAPAACCTNWRRRPASASCSSALSASARRWRCRRRRMPVSPIRLSHRGRHRRLEERRRTARALRGMGVKFELNRDFPRPLGCRSRRENRSKSPFKSLKRLFFRQRIIAFLEERIRASRRAFNMAHSQKSAKPAAAAKSKRPVTLKHLAAALAEEHQISKRAGEAILGDLVGTITKHLKKGERIRIAGSGHPAGQKARRPHGPQSRHRRSHQDQGRQESRIPGGQGLEDGYLARSYACRRPGDARCRGDDFWLGEAAEAGSLSVETGNGVAAYGVFFTSGHLDSDSGWKAWSAGMVATSL